MTQILVSVPLDIPGDAQSLLQLLAGELFVRGTLLYFVVPAGSEERVEDDALKTMIVAHNPVILLCKVHHNCIIDNTNNMEDNFHERISALRIYDG